MQLNDKYQQIRNLFTDYFVKLGHASVKSSDLIPYNDPSLMFVNSGMVQFKNVFLGLETRDYKTATTVQKSLRAGGKHNDLDNVGYTARHHTFFEMLGNFSFGEYFKENAIEYAWNFLTKEVNLNKDKLYITVYHTDDEAVKIWKKISGFSDEKIIKINTNDNFWSMGDTGPCGPCSEIYYDYGDKIFGGLPGTKDQDGDRFCEIWNLVFMQYNQTLDKNGEKIMSPLAKPCIDTGMGLERLISVLEGKTDNYDTSLFSNLIGNSRDILCDNSEKNRVAHRVIADHLRAASFLIAEGVLPSNEGRGYVLRRIMRRGMRYLHQINPNKTVMHELFDELARLMGSQYPELTKYKNLIKSTIEYEENGFKDTLARGMKFLDDEISSADVLKKFSGAKAFKLYDTYGFPLDMTKDILRGYKIELDEKEFDSVMQEQKKRSKANWGGTGDEKDEKIWFEIAEKVKSNFVGYESFSFSAKILGIVQGSEILQNISAKSGDEMYIILDNTPFYPLGGGQMGDVGHISIQSNSSKEIQVLDTQKYADDKIIAHKVKILSEVNLNINSEVFVQIDQEIRLKRAQNHSATHLLNAALRKVLGSHVVQKGSLVSEDFLRFDFSNPKAMAKSEILEVENLVNTWIRQAISGNTYEQSKEIAEKSGAVATFGDKYGDIVRVVNFGDISLEFCGGTHVKNTGNIGVFKIISECSVASGVRRIEAFTGEKAVAYLSNISEAMLDIAGKLKISLDLQNINNNNEILKEIEDLILNNKKFSEQIEVLKIKDLLLNNVAKISTPGCNFYIPNFSGIAGANVKNIMFKFGEKYPESVVIGIFKVGEGASIAIFSDVKNFSATQLVHFISTACDGVKSGGGTEKFAMSGVKKYTGNIAEIINNYK